MERRRRGPGEPLWTGGQVDVRRHMGVDARRVFHDASLGLQAGWRRDQGHGSPWLRQPQQGVHLALFDNLGNSGPWKGTVQGNTWTWTGDTEVAGKPLKERCTTVVAGADALTSKCEYSSDGTKWLPNFELKYTRGK